MHNALLFCYLDLKIGELIAYRNTIQNKGIFVVRVGVFFFRVEKPKNFNIVRVPNS